MGRHGAHQHPPARHRRGPGRDTVLTDVLLVVSVDPVAETAATISVPRDTGYVPLPDETIYADGLYPEKVNELATQASLDPATWCPDLADDAEACGLRTIERSIGLYLGIEIHHYALVDMAGFASMIDAIGGVELCLEGRLIDPLFDGSLTNAETNRGLVLEPGCRLYDGITALAYARSRQGYIEMPDGERVGQTDFDRAERQQRVLLAMRKELTEADTFLELPQLLSAIGRTVSTDFPRDQAGDFASLLPLIAGPDIERVVLGYPEFVDLPVEPEVNYLLIPKRDAIREEMARLFGLEALQGWYLGSTARRSDRRPGRRGGDALANVGQQNRDHSERGRDGGEEQHRVTLAEAEPQELMVEMPAIGDEERLAARRAPDDCPDRVGKGDSQGDDRHDRWHRL